jgi:hypothetical protein
MGIWALIIEHLSQNPNTTVGQLLSQKSGFACSKCGFFSPSRKSVEEHCGAKHKAREAEAIECQSTPAIRPGEGEGEDPDLRLELDKITQMAQPRHGTWEKEEAEVTGRQWFKMIMPQWQQGVQENQISRAEARFIRKDGSFPIFIKESILPMWKAWKGVSFEAIQGLYEMSIQMQRTKMHQLRNESKELFGPRTKLDGKQLEAKMKASRAARRSHQILKWTELISKALTWRTADLIAREVEMEMNDGVPIAVRTHEKVAEKKRKGLI